MPHRRKPDGARTVPVTVAAREVVTPNFLRVTLAGPGLDDYRFAGEDQWFRLFLPDGDQVRTLKGMDALSVLGYLVTPRSRRPTIRNYTTWAYRPAGAGRHGAHAELDVDVFVDGRHQGPGATWAAHAEPGSPGALLDEGRLYDPPADVGAHLLVADESALPAALGILRDAPAGWRGTAVIEIADPADRRDLPVPDGADVRWVVRGRDEPCGSAAAREARAIAVDPADYAYLAGPSSMVTGMRRHLVAGGLAKERICFTGYWREGRAAN